MCAESGRNAVSDFECLLTFLPPGWQAKAKELGALRRCRKVQDAATLLRVLLIHLADGCSLRTTAALVREGGIADLSDVAIMNRLRCSGEWFRWMSSGLMERWVVRQPGAVFPGRWNVRVIDATRVKEPGPTGSSWCIHYSVGLPSLRCDELSVKDPQGNGETFRWFTVRPGDLLMGDRAYGVAPGIEHVVRGGGDVLVRFSWTNLELWSSPKRRFNLLGHLRTLHGTRVGDWRVIVRGEKGDISGRVCAVKKSRDAGEKAQKDVVRAAQKHGTHPQPETLEAALYTFVFTTIPRELLASTPVLEFYRGRWQVELVFKRLKSILELGHLRKTDPDAAMAWLQGKLFVAFLLESLLHYGESFSPWGYPLPEAEPPQSLPVERTGIHAPSAPGRH